MCCWIGTLEFCPMRRPTIGNSSEGISVAESGYPLAVTIEWAGKISGDAPGTNNAGIFGGGFGVLLTRYAG